MCNSFMLNDPFILLFLTLFLCGIAWAGDRILTTDEDREAARRAHHLERNRQLRHPRNR